MRIHTIHFVTQICLLLVSLAIVATAFADESPNESKQANEPTKFVKKMAGTWQLDKGINQGNRLSVGELEGSRLLVRNDTIVTYDKDQKELYRATFVVDESHDPVHINMTTLMKGVPPMQALGIVKFEDDDQWSICYGLPGAPRPTKFSSTFGSKNMLFELEKAD